MLWSALAMQTAQAAPNATSRIRITPLVTPAPIDPAAPLTAPEQMFYFGAPLAHVVCYQERHKGLKSRRTWL